MAAGQEQAGLASGQRLEGLKIITPEQSRHLVALLSSCAHRDERAFERLYRATAPKLFGVALRILRRQDWAEEVLQESFVNIWNHAAEYAAYKSSPMTWMTSIVRNRCLDWLRRPTREASEDYEMLAGSLQNENPEPIELLMQSANTAALAHCLERLEARQRQSIMLAFFHGLSHSEVAGHLREPLGTVKTWIRRGLERLKGCLEASQ